MKTAPLAVKASPTHLSRNMRTADAYRAIASACLAHIAANRDGVAAADSESVHQMRVGLRRWKSAARLFGGMALPPERVQGEIAWLAGQLGPARDWDVLANGTLPAVAARYAGGADGAAAPALTPLCEAAQEVARQRRASAAAAVASARYAALIDDLAAWIGTLAPNGSEDGHGGDDEGDDGNGGAGTGNGNAGAGAGGIEGDLCRFARAAIGHDRKRLARRARHLAHADAAARHRVRIAAKKSRYDAEFFLSLHDSKSWRRYLRRLAAMQDELGKLNDARVAHDLLSELLDGGPPAPSGKAPAAGAPAQTGQLALAGAIGFVQGYLSAGQADGARRVKRLWRKLAPMRLRV